MAKAQLILLGGFLGAGKTTLLLNAARTMQEHGLRVGIITNDQGQELVDTASAQHAGIETREIALGCFCCRFDALFEAARDLAAPAKKQRRDAEQTTVIFAEVVGNCTDSATRVLRPLHKLYPEQFALAPLSIAVDALRLLQFIQDDSAQALTDDVTYLFAKQIEEADIAVLTKCDLVSFAEQELIYGWLKAHLPAVPVIPFSSLQSESIDDWLDAVIGSQGRIQVAAHELEFDYQRYAQAEQRIAWLNAWGILNALEEGAKAQGWAYSFLRALSERLDEEAISIAHIKLHISNAGDDEAIKASIVGPGQATIQWDQRAPHLEAHQAAWILNARADTTPEKLRTCVGETLVKLRYGAVAQVHTFDCFQPAPAHPMHSIKSTESAPYA